MVSVDFIHEKKIPRIKINYFQRFKYHKNRALSALKSINCQEVNLIFFQNEAGYVLGYSSKKFSKCIRSILSNKHSGY